MAFRNAIDINAISRMFEPKTQNPIEELMEGYLRPQERAIDFKSKQLAQALQEQYGAQSKEADIDYKRALTEYNRSMLGIPKSAIGGNLYDIMRMQQQGQLTDEEAEQAKRAVLLRQGGSGGARNIWSNLPPNVREDIIAQTAEYASPDEVARAINEGITLDEFKNLKKNQGYNVDSAEARYSPTQRNRSSVNELKGFNAEMSYLSDVYLDDVKDYMGARFKGYSVKQTFDALKGANPDKQAKFLARSAISSALAGVRTRVEGGSNSQEEMRNMRKKSLDELNALGITLTPEIYEKTTRYIEKALQEASKRRINAMTSLKKQTPRSKEAIMRDALQGKEVGVVQGGEDLPDETLGGTPIESNMPQQPEIDIVYVVNPNTGIRESMTRAEARRRGYRYRNEK